MSIIFVILILISAIALGLIVLIQNPKGGGLSGSFGGFGNQFMGVQQTTDVLEKGTWIFAGIIGFLCLVSPMFIPKNVSSSSKNDDLINKTSTNIPVTPANNNTTQMPGTQAPK